LKLNKRMIAEGGLVLLAEGGLDNLTTRRLADHFGIKSASLYHHFRNKRQLLDHVADAIVRPAWRAAAPGEPWDLWLTGVASRLRERILAFPDGALLYAGASLPEDRMEETLAVLFGPILEAGLSREFARRIILAVIRFTIGSTVDEQVFQDRGGNRDAATSEADFEFGLRTFVLGVSALLEQSRSASRGC